jgi:hypothetical protein
MNASIPQFPPGLPLGLGVVVWLSAFLSPTGYFLLILLASKSGIQNLPETFVVSLFILIPVVALVICEWVVWSCSKTVCRKIGWMTVTLLGMLLQFAILLLVLRMIIVMAIGYVQ